MDSNFFKQKMDSLNQQFEAVKKANADSTVTMTKIQGAYELADELRGEAEKLEGKDKKNGK